MTHTGEIKAGQQEMLAVRYRRRYRLCQVLTILGVIFLFALGSFSLVDGAEVLGTILIVNALVGLLNIYLLKRTGNVERAASILSGILFLLSMSLIITGGKNNTGLLWVYPIVAISLFINRFWPAVFWFVIFSVASILLLFTPASLLMMTSYSLVEAIRFILTMLALNAICLAALRSEEQAYQTIMQLHDDDIRKMAYYDTLTGLPNRWSFKTNLERLLSRAEKDKQRIGLLYIDLDNFKQVNDQYGHEAGDRLLLEFSERLWEEIRPTDQLLKPQTESLARLAGDEFVVLLPNIKAPLDASVVATRILNIFDGGFEVDDVTHMIYASIGIAVYPDDACDPSTLLHHADAAMYDAKHNGRNCFKFFTQNIADTLRQRQRIEKGLRQALNDAHFSLVYMPIFDCKDNSIVAIEVLLRCQSPELEGNSPELEGNSPKLEGISSELEGIGPDQFIPVAEATGLIKEIDLWVIENAFQALVTLQKEHDFKGQICINISGVELHNEVFPTQVKHLLEQYSIAPECVELEVTETAFVADDVSGLETLKALDELGVSLALDDFGTGYTAFSQLIHYPADCLKIDRSFVNDLFSEREARNKMVMIIQNLAKLYDLRVIAEGVETEAQMTYLRENGCDWAQGYYLSRPLPWDNLLKLLSA
ncbi:putative bifunctional diguanylate cyclase/phosphodiesterase [Alteromonas sp. Mac1]|uniref:putative bifunctional diguanylate cyclase/phosphodiesterase n=1 Tax=Alteromonas sp. Mac1 TaxID=1777491 RepID=UPI0007700EA4|nr:EAL domain-containing protein [Alteromonas sp. Mac1]AMJ85867.1 diguanylate cyclase [Alteromonas sp. Mac1]AMJ89725.1 diguanylate cyclase [Alteromonas sp. Mac2]